MLALYHEKMKADAIAADLASREQDDDGRDDDTSPNRENAEQ
jgi:hypothetical protein